MKKRIIFLGLIVLLVFAAKRFYPQELGKLQRDFLPSVLTGGDLRENILGIGKRISGDNNAVYVWENEMPTPSPKRQRVNVSADFPLKKMISQNLHTFEHPAKVSSINILHCVSRGEAAVDFGIAPSLAEKLLSSSGGKGGEHVPPETSPAPSAQPSPTLAPTPVPTPSPAPAPLPASDAQTKIDSFLQQQAAFGEYAIPSNVSCECPTLPFEYEAPTVSGVSSGFGYRVHPIRGDVRFHYGTDIPVVDGTDVKAFADGTVITAQECEGYGLTVILRHSDGYTTLYAHCSSLLVAYGDVVKSGQAIALSGHSGNVTGPHLHFELMRDGVYLNPEFYL